MAWMHVQKHYTMDKILYNFQHHPCGGLNSGFVHKLPLQGALIRSIDYTLHWSSALKVKEGSYLRSMTWPK